MAVNVYRYEQVVNLTPEPVEVFDYGLAASGGSVVVPVFRAGDAPSTLPRPVWARVWRRFQGQLMDYDKALRLGLLPLAEEQKVDELSDLKFYELRSIAKARGISVAVGTSKAALLAILEGKE